mmetsp:Transcript_15901/g.17744  ORF Transcript_15901/g.17744 Transcript_15901/m.17744 type:complete len:210 (-) Transcript_15901:75-704(-)
MACLIQAICDSGGSRLVDYSQDVESGNGARILGSLPLRVVKIGRDCDNGIFDLLAKETLGNFLHFDQYHGRYFFRLESLSFSLEPDFNHRFGGWSVNNFERPMSNVTLNRIITEFTADESFCIKDGVLGVSSNLIFCRITDQTFFVRKGDIRRSSTVALVIGDNLDFVVLQNSNTRIGSTQIYSNSGHDDKLVATMLGFQFKCNNGTLL